MSNRINQLVDRNCNYYMITEILFYFLVSVFVFMLKSNSSIIFLILFPVYREFIKNNNYSCRLIKEVLWLFFLGGPWCVDVSITLIQAIYQEQGYWAYRIGYFLMKPLLLLKEGVLTLYPDITESWQAFIVYWILVISLLGGSHLITWHVPMNWYKDVN